MSSEVCPFCGKTYKRLKSHLPHCKAATSSKTPPAKNDVRATRTSSSRLGEKSSQTLSVTAKSQQSKKVSEVSATLQSENASSPSQSSSHSTAAPPPSTKKKKQKLPEQTKTGAAAVSLTSTRSPPSSPANSKPRKKSLRALIEAAKSDQVSQGSLEEIPPPSRDRTSGPTQLAGEPLSSTITAQTETDTNPVKDTHAFLSPGAKPKGASKAKVSKKKKAEVKAIPKDTSSSLDFNIDKGNAKPHVGDTFSEGNKGEFENFLVNDTFLTSGRGHQARITLNNVKAALGRANATRQPSILSQIVSTNNDLSSKVRPGSHLSPAPVPTGNQEDVIRLAVTTEALSEELPSTRSEHAELKPVKRKSSKSKETSSVPKRHDASPQSGLTSHNPPLPSAILSSQVGQVKSPPQKLHVNEGPEVGHHTTGLATMSPSLTRISSGQSFPLGPQTVRVEILRASDGLMMEKSQLGVRDRNTADSGNKGQRLTVKSPLTQQRLGQVRLKELPEWLAFKAPRRPSDAVTMVQRGWQWYYKRYIDVKKGGVGGLSMLLAGYCVLSYIWSYPHIKRDRWRKHH